MSHQHCRKASNPRELTQSAGSRALSLLMSSELRLCFHSFAQRNVEGVLNTCPVLGVSVGVKPPTSYHLKNGWLSSYPSLRGDQRSKNWGPTVSSDDSAMCSGDSRSAPVLAGNSLPANPPFVCATPAVPLDPLPPIILVNPAFLSRNSLRSFGQLPSIVFNDKIRRNLSLSSLC